MPINHWFIQMMLVWLVKKEFRCVSKIPNFYAKGSKSIGPLTAWWLENPALPKLPPRLATHRVI